MGLHMTTTNPDFPNVDMSILTDWEQMLIQLSCAEGWSLRRISRALSDLTSHKRGTSKSSLSRQHYAAARRLYESGGLRHLCSERDICTHIDREVHEQATAEEQETQ